MTGWVVGHREQDFSLDLGHAVEVIEHRPTVVRPVPQQPDGHGAAIDTVKTVTRLPPTSAGSW